MHKMIGAKFVFLLCLLILQSAFINHGDAWSIFDFLAPAREIESNSTTAAALDDATVAATTSLASEASEGPKIFFSLEDEPTTTVAPILPEDTPETTTMETPQVEETQEETTTAEEVPEIVVTEKPSEVITEEAAPETQESTQPSELPEVQTENTEPVKASEEVFWFAEPSEITTIQVDQDELSTAQPSEDIESSIVEETDATSASPVSPERAEEINVNPDVAPTTDKYVPTQLDEDIAGAEVPKDEKEPGSGGEITTQDFDDRETSTETATEESNPESNESWWSKMQTNLRPQTQWFDVDPDSQMNNILDEVLEANGTQAPAREQESPYEERPIQREEYPEDPYYSLGSNEDQDRYESNSDPYASNVDPYASNPDPYATNSDPYASNSDPNSPNNYDPYADRQDPDPYASNQDPYSSNSDPYASTPDPYASNPDTYSQDPYASSPSPDPYATNQDPYSSNADPYNPDPYASGQDPYASQNWTEPYRSGNDDGYWSTGSEDGQSWNGESYDPYATGQDQSSYGVLYNSSTGERIDPVEQDPYRGYEEDPYRKPPYEDPSRGYNQPEWSDPNYPPVDPYNSRGPYDYDSRYDNYPPQTYNDTAYDPYYPETDKDQYRFVPDKSEEGFDPPYQPRRGVTPWLRRDKNQGYPRNEACNQAVEPGDGPDETNSWFFDKQSGECRWFAYSGYGGNANRFYSRQSCEKLCIEENDDPCAGVECSSRTMVCQGVVDEACLRYNAQSPERCPPKQPVCVTRAGRGIRVAPKLREHMTPEICKQPKNPGNCQRKKDISVVYYYDPAQKICQSLYFNECGGNDNRFRTKDDCMNFCSP